MKSLKQIISLLLALIMVLSMGIIAFAEEEDPDAGKTKGKITIKYAEVGQTYTLYRVFDAD